LELICGGDRAGGSFRRSSLQRSSFVKQFIVLVLIICIPVACRPRAKSDKSYDQICRMVSGKTEAEVESLLGKPDRLDHLPYGEERWTWWNYTYLEGKDWAPEVRNQVVHLEITFAAPLIAPVSVAERSSWRVSDPYGVGYVIPRDGLNKDVRGRV
jgi:hypothetical protein